MGINKVSPSTSTTAVLIADSYVAPGGSQDSIPTMTKVGDNTVAAALEVQSTEGGILFPRMTSAQMNALTPVVNGMMLYNTDLESAFIRQNGSFSPLNTVKSLSITSAGFIGMFNTPILFIPAPGAGKYIFPIVSNLSLNWGTTQYTGGGRISYQYGNTPQAGGSTDAAIFSAAQTTSINSAVASTLFTGITLNFDATVLMSNIVNQGIYITNATAAYATGNSAFVANLQYVILSV
jgi:hypothetical protein